LPQQKVDIEIPEKLPPSAREELGDLIIEHIVDRTQRGKDKNGKDFPSYSESYVKSLDFKIAGKSKNKVNLELSGDMLAAIQLLSSKKGKLTIGFERGADENGRAEGNILGSYGGTPNKSKARDFLGIEKEKLKELVKYVKEQYDL
jgi:hypothetical protein